MAIEIPADWPVRRWHEDTPLAHLETVATDAPSGQAPRRWEVASWESTREIASSALPGQVRHKTGLSVGTAKALVRRAADDYPWRQRDVYDLTGSQAQILLAPERRTEIPTGQFRVAPVEGDLTTLGVDVELDERQIQGRDKAANVLGEQWKTQAHFDAGIADPSWLVSELAQQMGYGVAVPPGGRLSDGSVYSPVLDAPLQGSMTPEYPDGIDYFQSSGDWTWRELDGLVAWSPADGEGTTGVSYEIALARPPATATITADVYGQLGFRWQANPAGYLHVSVENRTFSSVTPETTIQLRLFSAGSNGSSNTTTLQTFTGIAPVTDRPSGIQLQVEPTFNASGTITSWRARVRRGAGSAWSAWVTHAMANTIATTDTTTFDVLLNASDGTDGSPGRVSRVSVSSGSNTPDALWNNQQGENGRLYLEPLFGTIRSPWIDPDLTVLNAIQAIVEAWQGALITDVYGDLRLLNRFSLSGVATGDEPVVDIGVNFEDLPWVMDAADQADRLTVTYRPVILRQSDLSGSVPSVPIVWQLDEVRPFWPGVTELFFSLDYIYPVDLKVLPFVRKDFDNGVYHVWDAYRYNNGTGTHITPNDQIQMRIDRVTSSTWKVHVVNLTAEPFHMVDNTGTPYLKIRSTYYLDQTQEAVIERGLPSTEAVNPLEVNLANYVQNEADANALADFIWSRVNRRTWRAKTVRTVPDYSIDLGDVREIVHSRTKMRSNVLVSKVKLAGEPGSVTQELDLILIPPTWEDFDEAWAAYQPNPPGSWAEFDALWAPYTWNDFDRTPTATTVAQIEEGM
jgi:hypothetical protein